MKERDMERKRDCLTLVFDVSEVCDILEATRTQEKEQMTLFIFPN